MDQQRRPGAAREGDSWGAGDHDPATSTGWPAVEYEEHGWVSTLDIPRRWQSTFSGPYRAAVVPEICRLDPVLSAATAALADEATAEFARFDAEMGSEIAPFGAILLRSEAAASSRIENLTASAKAVALAELGDTSRRNATEIVANTTAMTAAIALADRLDAPAILAMHAALLEHHDPKHAGTWRGAQVWVGSSSYGPHTASFVPPHHTRVAPAIDDLVCFMHRGDVPVLSHAAIAHAQFETIHPFADGNGRTGRAIVHCLLRGKRLTRQVTVPISAGLLADTDRYFDALTAYRAGVIQPIVERFAEASFDSIVNGRQLVSDLARGPCCVERCDHESTPGDRLANTRRRVPTPGARQHAHPARARRLGDGSRRCDHRARRNRRVAGDHRWPTQPTVRSDPSTRRARRLRGTCRTSVPVSRCDRGPGQNAELLDQQNLMPSVGRADRLARAVLGRRRAGSRDPAPWRTVTSWETSPSAVVPIPDGASVALGARSCAVRSALGSRTLRRFPSAVDCP